MKINRKKLIEALAYRKKINKANFFDLDWSEFPEILNMPDLEQRKKDFEKIGLNNIDFYLIYVEENKRKIK